MERDPRSRRGQAPCLSQDGVSLSAAQPALLFIASPGLGKGMGIKLSLLQELV